MHVLYVEDDPLDADLTRRALQKNAPDVHIDIARTQAEAVQRLDSSVVYDVMLTDLRLPDGSGFALLTHARERGLPTAVVVITGQGDEEIAVSVLKAGADDYMVKREAYLEHLPATLENAVERQRAEAARRARALRVLYLESDARDAQHSQGHFASHAPHIHLDIVYSVGEVLLRLPAGGQLEYDAVVLNHEHTALNAFDVLKELRQVRKLDLPIVLVTGHGNEDVAIQALRLGASEYVVKSPGYLLRLPGLLENAYHRAQLLREQAALRDSEERFRRLAENAPDVIFRIRVMPDVQVEYASPAVTQVSGFTPDEFYADPDLLWRVIHTEDAPKFGNWRMGQSSGRIPTAFRLVRKDEAVIWAEVRGVPIYDEAGNPYAYEGVIRDVTERKQAEENIKRQLQRLHALRTVDTAITASLDLRVTLDVLLENVAIQLGVHAADVLLLNAPMQVLEFGAGVGFRTPVKEGERLNLDEGSAGKVVLQRCTVQVMGQEIISQPKILPKWLAGEGFVAYCGTPLIAKGQVKGVLEAYHRQPMAPDGEWLNFFETLAGQAAIAIENAEMFENIQQANLELTMAYDRTLEGWVRALDLRDKETQGHTQRVTEITLRLAGAMGISDDMLVHVRRGALLHDIGKIGIPDNILHKPGPLSEDEWLIMRQHPVYAYELLTPIDYLRPAVEIPHSHHEKWDGSGYPQGLKGEQIPLAARIFAVVDVWDALTSDRPYRSAWNLERVLEYLRSQSGSHFDPHVVASFIKLVE
ncbi:MAG: HD domain-containing phosphohydrolase [Chloroflexota bacterium]